jgi:hypothetical protein
MSILRTRRFVLVGSASILATLLASSTTPIAMATSTGQTDGASNDAANYAKVILANHPAIYYRLVRQL